MMVGMLDTPSDSGVSRRILGLRMFSIWTRHCHSCVLLSTRVLVNVNIIFDTIFACS